MSLKRRKFLPWPFNYAKNWYGVELSKTDIEYIDNVITADKMYRLILQAYNIDRHTITVNNPDLCDKPNVVTIEQGLYQSFIILCNALHFFRKFLDDQRCPNGVKYFLYKWIGQNIGYMKQADMYVYDIYLQRSFFTERWFEICR